MGGADQEEERGSPVAVNRGDGGGEREVSDSGDGSGGNGGSNNNVDSAYQQRYDLQQVSRWIEHILPFSLLLLIVFIRQHLQGLFVTIYITAFMYKSNDILRKQTALKGERKLSKRKTSKIKEEKRVTSTTRFPSRFELVESSQRCNKVLDENNLIDLNAYPFDTCDLDSPF